MLANARTSRGPKHGVSKRLDDVLQGDADAYESKTKETRKPSDDTFKVVRTRRIPKVITLAEHNIGEKEIMLFDRIALEETRLYNHES